MIIVLAGRRIDSPDTTPPRFPLSQVPVVQKRLQTFFEQHQATSLVCSGACGADLLALAVAGKLRMRRRLVLPFDQETFRSLSVTDRPGDWGPLFDQVYDQLAHDNQVVVLHYSPTDKTAYTKTNRAIFTEAAAFTQNNSWQEASQEPFWKKAMALLVWDGNPRKEGDATADFADEAHRQGIPVKEIFTL